VRAADTPSPTAKAPASEGATCMLTCCAKLADSLRVYRAGARARKAGLAIRGRVSPTASRGRSGEFHPPLVPPLLLSGVNRDPSVGAASLSWNSLCYVKAAITASVIAC
jgi:hypothetical protein